MTKIFDEKPRRVTLFAGHYGSGKTTAAVNYALWLKEKGYDTAIADLDIVNPYFRTRDSIDALNQAGVRLIASPFAGSNVDAPALPGEAYAVVEDKSLHAVIDVGGDDRGALALGRITPGILEENDYEMLLVINGFRPLTRDAESTLEVMREIEAAAGIRCTGLVNNTNLGKETTAEDVLESVKYAEECAKLCGVPVKMTTVEESLAGELEGKIANLMPVTIRRKYKWN